MVLKIFIWSSTSGQSYSSIIFDKKQSEYFGAYNLLTLQKGIYLLQDKLLPDTFVSENTNSRKAIGFGYRMMKVFLIDFQEDFFITLVQHEFFGHGARYREFGHRENIYSFSPFFPFGSGNGSAHSGPLKSGEKITPYESITKVLAGNEANLVLAKTLSSQFLLADTIHYRQALLYLISQNNQLEYIWLSRVKSRDPTFGNGDIDSYIYSINSFHGNASGKQYTINQISEQSLISLANPLQLYSLYSLLFQYGIKGKKHLCNIPMIRIGNVRYLPLFNYTLTPFGSEYVFTNFIKHKGRMYNLDISFGDNTFNSFTQGALKVFNVVDNKSFQINMQGVIWHQPELELENPSIHPGSKTTGGAFKIDLSIRPVKIKNALGLTMQTGYKTKGYLMGEPLARTFILRAGLSFDF